MTKARRKTAIRGMALAVIFVMLAWLLPANWQDASAAAYPKSPRRTSSGIVTWDCVWFGHYPQSSNGKGGYQTKPIKWRVLAVKKGKALLLADKILDVQPYNETYNESVTWKTSTIRSWLNGYGSRSNLGGKTYARNNFIDRAFNGWEQRAIIKRPVQTPSRFKSRKKGLKTTRDKIFLMSTVEATKPAYGFQKNYTYTKARTAVNTAYTAREYSMRHEGSTDIWWLRSFVDGPPLWCNGYLANDDISVDAHVGVRPMLWLDLSSSAWRSAGNKRIATK